MVNALILQSLIGLAIGIVVLLDWLGRRRNRSRHAARHQ